MSNLICFFAGLSLAMTASVPAQTKAEWRAARHDREAKYEEVMAKCRNQAKEIVR